MRRLYIWVYAMIVRIVFPVIISKNHGQRFPFRSAMFRKPMGNVLQDYGQCLGK